MKSTVTVFILVTGLLLPAAGKNYRLNIRDYPTTIKQLSDLAQRARRTRPRPSAPPTTIKQLSDIAQQLEPDKLLGKRRVGHRFMIQGDVFTFDQGDLPTLTNPHGYASTAEMPLLIPLARHIQLVALREYIQQQPNADPAFWESYFKEADVILEESLAAIDAAQLDPQAIHELVKNKDADIQNIFGERAPNDFAQSRKLQRKRYGLRIGRIFPQSVTFSISPPHKQFLVVEETAYRLALHFNTEPPWREIPTIKTPLGGCYKYRVIWPDSATREERICVEASNQHFQITR